MSRSRDAHASRDALAATFAGVTGADVAFAARAIEVRARASERATPMGRKRSRVTDARGRARCARAGVERARAVRAR